jgi:hypothetical protein
MQFFALQDSEQEQDHPHELETNQQTTEVGDEVTRSTDKAGGERRAKGEGREGKGSRERRNQQ